MGKNKDSLYDCSPDTSNTDIEVKNDRKLLQDITGIFNFLASIFASLFLIFGFKRLVSTIEINKGIKLHFIWLLLLICGGFIIFFYGLFGKRTGYTMWGLINFSIPVVYIVLTSISNPNFRKNINISRIFLDDYKRSFMLLPPLLVFISLIFLIIFFVLFYVLMNKKKKIIKMKKNKMFLPTMITLILTGSIIVSLLISSILPNYELNQ